MGLILPFEGKTPRIDPSAFIAPNATIIGDVVIGPDASIWYGCVLRGDVNAIRIGARTNIQDGTVIHVASHRPGQKGLATEVGQDVTVGHMALLHACMVEDHSFVGMKAIALDGSKIETGGMLAAGAMLTPNKTSPSGELWAGSPAKFLRSLQDSEDLSFRDSAAYYVKLAQQHKLMNAK